MQSIRLGSTAEQWNRANILTFLSLLPQPAADSGSPGGKQTHSQVPIRVNHKKLEMHCNCSLSDYFRILLNMRQLLTKNLAKNICSFLQIIICNLKMKRGP